MQRIPALRGPLAPSSPCGVEAMHAGHDRRACLASLSRPNTAHASVGGRMEGMALQLSCSLASKGTYMPTTLVHKHAFAVPHVALHSPRPLPPSFSAPPFQHQRPTSHLHSCTHLCGAFLPRRLSKPPAGAPQLTRLHGGGGHPWHATETVASRYSTRVGNAGPTPPAIHVDPPLLLLLEPHHHAADVVVAAPLERLLHAQREQYKQHGTAVRQGAVPPVAGLRSSRSKAAHCRVTSSTK